MVGKPLMPNSVARGLFSSSVQSTLARVILGSFPANVVAAVSHSGASACTTEELAFNSQIDTVTAYSIAQVGKDK